MRYVPIAIILLALAGCSGGDKAATTTTAVKPAAAVSILNGSARTVTFPQVRRSIHRLYARHPSIRSFVYQDVVYTPTTRDRVLSVCREGTAASNARELETSRVFGCAPLIFFFYSFGKQKHVPESVAVARDLFWYAARIKGPYDALPPLTDLLQRWGVT